MDYVKEQNKMKSILQELFDLINNVGIHHGGLTKKDIGVVKITFLTLAERINRNISGILALLNYDELTIKNNRQPTMLLLRAIIEDLIIGSHLFAYRDNNDWFENELNVIALDYCRFSEFIINNEIYYEFANQEYKGKTLEERFALRDKHLLAFRKEHKKLYQVDNGASIMKKAKQLRETTEPNLLKYINKEKIEKNFLKQKNSLNNIYEIQLGIGLNNPSDEILQSSYSYLLYRVLSQYQHFTFVLSEQKLNKEPEFEVSLIFKSIRQIILMIYKFFQVLEIQEEDKDRFAKLITKFLEED